MLCDSLHGRHSSTITTIPLALFSAACRMVYLAAACETKLGVDSVQWNSKSPRNVVLCSLSITHNTYYSYLVNWNDQIKLNSTSHDNLPSQFGSLLNTFRG